MQAHFDLIPLAFCALVVKERLCMNCEHLCTGCQGEVMHNCKLVDALNSISSKECWFCISYLSANTFTTGTFAILFRNALLVL